ncbi:MBL fold metallo-hydrolase [Microbacterium sp. KSW4-11]|uniref:MBL fold metallo-hydrolase n=1 Tax=Microbacterium gawkjiense TaxID=3067309 RepID=A0ABU3GC75_9MICO|nr:MBL fold metallo-hydrolase [Microbacterium sp. KSW4-11]MDT3317091.1 MBL fold metallo-hydrolase [Microbacterium sp. KSW4-11]
MTMPAPWVEDRPGFFRITVAATNCYLVLAADGVTLVDAGLPASRKVLDALLKHLGLRVQDIDAVLLTHGHFDHVGVARSLHASGVPVRVHTADRRLARHPYRYRPAVARVPYLLTHPSGMPIIGRMAAAGALAVRGVDAEASVPPSGVMDVPGRPTVVHTPGHTDGHCAFFFRAHGILLSGDALVTLDPYTGVRGPQIVANAATKDAAQSLRSLDALESTGAAVVLPGHGDPWTTGVAAAVQRARIVGEH